MTFPAVKNKINGINGIPNSGIRNSSPSQQTHYIHFYMHIYICIQKHSQPSGLRAGGNIQAQSHTDGSARLLDHDRFASHPLWNTAEQAFHFKLCTFMPWNVSLRLTYVLSSISPGKVAAEGCTDASCSPWSRAGTHPFRPPSAA